MKLKVFEAHESTDGTLQRYYGVDTDLGLRLDSGNRILLAPDSSTDGT